MIIDPSNNLTVEDLLKIDFTK